MVECRKAQTKSTTRNFVKLFVQTGNEDVVVRVSCPTAVAEVRVAGDSDRQIASYMEIAHIWGFPYINSHRAAKKQTIS